MVSKQFSASLVRAAALSALLLLAGCGGSVSRDDSAPEPEPAPPAPQPQPEPTPTPPAPTPPPDGVTLASTYTELGDSGTLGEVNWSDTSGTGAPISGVNCMGSIVSHNHAHISIYRDGVRLAVPRNIGIVPGCTYELHTHQRTGIVHIEPNVARPLTLAQFFAVWGQPLSRSAVAGLAGPVRYYIIENEVLSRFDGNPADIVLTKHKEIVIVTGSAPIVLPKHRWALSF